MKNISIDQAINFKWNFVRSGAISGAVSTFIFAIVHHIFISDIWFSLIFMLTAGILCGVCVGWSYAHLFKVYTAGNWIRYNLLYDIMLMLLGLVSVLVFDPVTTLAAVIAANEPPVELIKQATPITVLFTFAMAVIINQLYGRSWKLFGIALVTCIVLVLLLGLNVSTIGLVSFAGSSLFLILELFLLILSINIVYALVFILLERRRLIIKNRSHSIEDHME